MGKKEEGKMIGNRDVQRKGEKWDVKTARRKGIQEVQ